MSQHSSQVMAGGDRRVRRTRAALFEAAVRLVSERGTTSIAVTELADAAGVSRQVVYLQFGDRESLLAAAAMDLTERELYPLLPDLGEDTLRHRIHSAARHLAGHHRFYRALVTGSCGFALRTAAIRSFEDLHRRNPVPVLENMRPHTAAAGTFLVGGVMAVIDDWLLETEREPDPTVLAERLLAMAAHFTDLRPR
ncbi:AcrR family transcriptional regulator [Nocardia transvalensis]|uniref:AcrR family transcriptional regulator n=1 Tax=Nocardia transvalensis TaxID=37333 RepID=A0A7W9UK99_9NOCA|nr:TetR/AcrR family transcriptional regulator [Nocardia transvalensis]MBB5916234.1 AcrR family transcriptional regulator [Nocardia transvalensis]